MELYRGKQRIQRMRHSGDIIFNSNTGNVTDYEDVPIIGTWTDQLVDGTTQSGGTGENQLMKFAGTANKLWGTNAAVLGIKRDKLTPRGNNAETTRVKRKIVYIE